MTDLTINLRHAVDQLTREHDYPVTQHGRHLGTRHQQPLLTELEKARTARIGTGGGNHAAHERSPLNVAASDLYANIADRIRGWARAAGIKQHWAQPGPAIDWTDLPALLRSWHAASLSMHVDLDPYLDTLQGWITSITNLILDPPRRWYLDAPCPICGATQVLLGAGEAQPALTVIERDPMTETIVICNYCAILGINTQWKGIEGARTLSGQIQPTGDAA